MSRPDPDRLSALVAASGSVETAAGVLGVHPSTVYRWMREDGQPTPAYVRGGRRCSVRISLTEEEMALACARAEREGVTLAALARRGLAG